MSASGGPSGQVKISRDAIPLGSTPVAFRAGRTSQGRAGSCRRPGGLFVLGLLLGLGALFGCESKAVKACRTKYMATHALVNAVDTQKLESVEAALEAVIATRALCEAAELREELKQLKGVQSSLEGYSEYLRQYGNRKELTEQALQTLVKQGDPGCPTGQMYNYRKTGKQVRCTGPQIVTMNWKQAEEYYSARGFKLHTSGGQLKAEYGSESYTFYFKGPGDTGRASCVEVFASPGIPWEESVARVTGALPQRLEKGEPVQSKAGKFQIVHVEDETQAIYKLGDCSQ
jgi:hypothetical protein